MGGDVGEQSLILLVSNEKDQSDVLRHNAWVPDGVNRMVCQASKDLEIGKHNGLYSDGPVHRFRTSLSNLFSHSWCKILHSSWRWIPRHMCLGDLEFLARSSEVLRLGSHAKVVR